jgi:hypothetical protein
MIEKPIFIGECDGRPLKVIGLTSRVNASGQPYFYFYVSLYTTEWDGSKIEFMRLKVQSYGKCDFQDGDVVYITDCPKGKWLSVYRYRKRDGTYATQFTIFANVSKEKPNREKFLKERRESDE